MATASSGSSSVEYGLTIGRPHFSSRRPAWDSSEALADAACTITSVFGKPCVCMTTVPPGLPFVLSRAAGLAVRLAEAETAGVPGRAAVDVATAAAVGTLEADGLALEFALLLLLQ